MNALDAIKQSSTKDALLLIIDDPVAKKVLFAWTNLYPAYTDFDSANMTLKEILDKAWSTTLDFEQLSRIAGLPRRTVEEKIIQLARARLIFPDGTASPFALKVIEAEISGKVRKFIGGKKAAEEK